MNRIVTALAVGMLAGHADASAPPANTIWGFTDDTKTTLWERCGQDSKQCVVVASTRHYVALVNRQSNRGCALGDLYITERDSASYKQLDTGTCSPNGYIVKGTYHNGQYLSVDIGVGGTLVKQYPIGYWSLQKEFSGPNKPSWEKARAAAAKEREAAAELNRKNHVSRWALDKGNIYSLGNHDKSKVLEVNCSTVSSIPTSVRFTSHFDSYLGSSLTLTIDKVSYAVPDDTHAKMAEWSILFKAITTATRIDVTADGKRAESFRIDPGSAKGMLNDERCQPHQDK